MEQLKKEVIALWGGLSMLKRVAIIGAAVAVLVGMTMPRMTYTECLVKYRTSGISVMNMCRDKSTWGLPFTGR